ncbi:MAG: substrate-binding domain-containing protein [Thermoguttaceae bacterium]
MRKRTYLSAATLLIGVLAFGGGCGPQEANREIIILCGSSFRPPTEKLAEMFEAETGIAVKMTFGGSEDHLPHVKAKSAGDVYVTHTPFIQYTDEAGSLLREVKVGFLAPVLVVAKGNPKKIARIEDLAQPGLEVVLPNPVYSTCGEMVDALLEKKGIKDAVLKNTGSALMEHHSEIGNHLKIGTREAGIMWNGVANNYLDVLEIVPGSYEYGEEIGVSVMGLSYTDDKEAVEQFLDFVAEHGEKVFADFGYVK